MQIFFLTMDQAGSGKRWLLSVLASDAKQARLLAKRSLPDAEITDERAGPKKPEVFDIKPFGDIAAKT